MNFTLDSHGACGSKGKSIVDGGRSGGEELSIHAYTIESLLNGKTQEVLSLSWEQGDSRRPLFATWSDPPILDHESQGTSQNLHYMEIESMREIARPKLGRVLPYRGNRGTITHVSFFLPDRP